MIFHSLEKNDTQTLEKLYEGAIIDKRIYKKKLEKETDPKMIIHFKCHIRQMNSMKRMIKKILKERNDNDS